MHMITKLLLLLVLTTKACSGRHRNIKLGAVQSTGTLDGLGCAVDEPLQWSGAKFDTQTGKCTKLPKNWFANPSYEPNNNYFMLKEFHSIVPEVELKNTLIPPIFVPGGSVVSLLQTSDTPDNGLQMIDFVNSEFSREVHQLFGTVALHNKFVPPDFYFFTFMNNVWGPGEWTPYPLSQANHQYKFDWHFTTTHVQISLDNVNFYNYSHRVALDMYGRVWIYEGPLFNVTKLYFTYY